MTKRHPKRPSRPEGPPLPSDDEIDAEVMKLIRNGCWQELKTLLRRYARQIRFPANLILLTIMNDAMLQFVFDHPELAAEVVSSLEAADEAVAARGETGKVYSLDEIVENLRQAAQNLRQAAPKYFPMVH
jgi:hypothetical protein